MIIKQLSIACTTYVQTLPNNISPHGSPGLHTANPSYVPRTPPFPCIAKSFVPCHRKLQLLLLCHLRLMPAKCIQYDSKLYLHYKLKFTIMEFHHDLITIRLSWLTLPLPSGTWCNDTSERVGSNGWNSSPVSNTVHYGSSKSLPGSHLLCFRLYKRQLGGLVCQHSSLRTHFSLSKSCFSDDFCLNLFFEFLFVRRDEPG